MENYSSTGEVIRVVYAVGAFLLALIGAWLRGGSFHNLRFLELERAGFFLAALLLQLVLWLGAPYFNERIATWPAWTLGISLLSYLFLFVALASNARIPGMKPLFLGCVLKLGEMLAKNWAYQLWLERVGDAVIIIGLAVFVHQALMGPPSRRRSAVRSV
ncbi:MAG: DUF5317 family protein [Bacillota bacterium]